MRTNDRIVFVGETEPDTYNTETGKWEVGKSSRTSRPCHISDLGLDRSMALFGDYKTSRKTVRLIRPYTKPYKSLEYKGEPYRLLSIRQNSTVFVIEKDSVMPHVN